MFSLTRQEQIAIASVLLALVFGSVVKHCRQTYRATHPAASVTVGSPSRNSFMLR